jgi:hypothetical protein
VVRGWLLRQWLKRNCKCLKIFLCSVLQEQSPYLSMSVTAKGLTDITEGELQALREEENRQKVGR